MKKKILIASIVASLVAVAFAYEEFYQGLSISTGAVPLTFHETDNTGEGARWRMPLDGGVLRFDVSTSGFFEQYVTAMRLTPNGDVGIGTWSPATKLDVNGTITSRSNYGLVITPASGDAIIRRGNGGSLMISSGGGPTDIRFNYNYGGGSGGILVFDGGTVNYGSLKASSAGDLLLSSLSGNVGIGTSDPQYPLSVNGTIQAKEVIVKTGWSDFVFEDGYDLRSLSELESHIEEYGHLPDVPSAKTIESEGLSVGEAQKLMMQKLEELTLYVIEQNKSLEKKNRQVEALLDRVDRLEALVE